MSSAAKQGVQGPVENSSLGKYRISQPGDALELEADRVADDVLRMPDPGGVGVIAGAPPLQRKCTACEAGDAPCPACSLSVTPVPVSHTHGQLRRQPIVSEEENLQHQALEEEEDEMQLRRQPGPAAIRVLEGAHQAVRAVRGGGVMLSDSVRNYFEPRFGADLGGVRVHTGDVGARASSAINARAFTVGNSIAFAPGQFDPSGAHGRRLLAHELTHVLQQRDGNDAGPQRSVDEEQATVPIQAEVEPQALDVSGAIDLLGDSLNRGVEELERAAQALPLPDLGAALEQLPDVAKALLAKWWPDYTGWSANVEVSGGGTLALTDFYVPGEMTLDAGVTCGMSMRREGWSLIVELKPGMNIDIAGVPSIKILELPIGITGKNLLGGRLTIDLEHAQWPTAALAALMSGDLGNALLSMLMTTATQVRLEAAQEGTVYVKGEAGSDTLAQAMVKVGGRLGAKVVVENATEQKPGRVDTQAEVGPFINIDLSVFDGTLPDPTGWVTDLARTWLKLLGNAGANLGMRCSIVFPALKDSKPPYMEVGLYLTGSGSGAAIGQDAMVNGRSEIVLSLEEIPGFIDGLENGNLELSGLDRSLLLKGMLTGQVTFHDLGLSDYLVSWFPGLSGLPGKERLQGTLTGAVEITVGEMLELMGHSIQASNFIMSAVRLGFLGALREWTDSSLEGMADIVRMLRSVTVHIEVGREGGLSGETPLEGDITGAKGAIKGSISGVYHRVFNPGEIGSATLEKWLRGLIEDQGEPESYLPEGPRDAWGPRPGWGPGGPAALLGSARR